MPTPSLENTLLCLFSGDTCLLIDDCAHKVQQVSKITDIWPQLGDYSMDSDLDAAYFCPEFDQVAFFKAEKCAIYNYKTDKWVQKTIKDFFVVPAGQEKYYSGITAASTGVREQNIAFYQNHEYINGPIGDPTAAPVSLSQGPSKVEDNGWTNLTPQQTIVASTLMCRTTGANAGDPNSPVRSMIFKDTDGTYKFTFDDTNNPPPAITGSFPLKELWPEYDDNKYPINAATRVDISMLNQTQNPPCPCDSSNSLCDELANIMKSVCSLTLLMHKVVDACYPPSSWPTQPYPDGCSTNGHKHHGCGGKGHHHKKCNCADNKS
jgi:hypothetical protein